MVRALICVLRVFFYFCAEREMGPGLQATCDDSSFSPSLYIDDIGVWTFATYDDSLYSFELREGASVKARRKKRLGTLLYNDKLARLP